MASLLHMLLALVTLLGGGGSAPSPAPLEVKVPEHGRPAGQLLVPRLRLRAPIAQGTSHHQLATNVGHLEASYLPGMGGDVELFGHDVTPWRQLPHGPFHDLPRLRPGDRITVVEPWGRYTYEVTGHRIVSEASWWRDFRPGLHAERLVLATCWPRYSSAERYVVLARPTW